MCTYSYIQQLSMVNARYSWASQYSLRNPSSLCMMHVRFLFLLISINVEGDADWRWVTLMLLGK